MTLHLVSTSKLAALLLIATCVASGIRAAEIQSRSKQTAAAESRAIRQQTTIETLGQSERHYAVVLDCGSTGTRAHIYYWPSDESEDPAAGGGVAPLRDPLTRRPLQARIRPGLTVVRNNPDEASDYIKPLIEFAEQNVPAHKQPATPIYILATGGMRQLSAREQKDIFDDILRDVRKQFKFKMIDTQVISGQLEGAYQWLSVNAQSRRLTSLFAPPETHSDFHYRAKETNRFGVIEIGGASAQVSFEVSSPLDFYVAQFLWARSEALAAFRSSRVHLSDAQADAPNQPVELFSVTFLGFGSNSARELAIDLLVRDSVRLTTSRQMAPPSTFFPYFYAPNTTLVIEDPCLPNGAEDKTVKPVELLYGQSKTIGYAPPGEQTEIFIVRLIGRANAVLCRVLLNRVVLLSKQEQSTCKTPAPDEAEQIEEKICESSLIGTYFVPWRRLPFVGLGDLYYTTHEMIRASGRFNMALVQRETYRICATPYATLRRQYPEANRFDSRRVLLECFKANWLLAFLQTGLLMPADFGVELETINEINREEIDWTLGAMIERKLPVTGTTTIRAPNHQAEW